MSGFAPREGSVSRTVLHTTVHHLRFQPHKQSVLKSTLIVNQICFPMQNFSSSFYWFVSAIHVEQTCHTKPQTCRSFFKTALIPAFQEGASWTTDTKWVAKFGFVPKIAQHDRAPCQGCSPLPAVKQVYGANFGLRLTHKWSMVRLINPCSVLHSCSSACLLPPQSALFMT